MVMLNRREIQNDQALKAARIGGYLVLLSIFFSIAFGVYALFNPELFSNFINISIYESRTFFLGVYLPSSVITVAIGYVFATMPKLENLNMWHTTALCSLILLCLALSALSIFNILSFFGAIIILIAVVHAHTKPTFKTMWKREACFFVEIGTILIASSSMIFLLMFTISLFLQTYSVVMYGISYIYPILLLVIEVLALIAFLLTPFLGLYRLNVEFSGIIGFMVAISSFIVATQNHYFFASLSGHLGIFLVIIGSLLTLSGALIYFKLFFSEFLLEPAIEPSFLYKGKYCPFCGALWANAKKDHCSFCGKNLFGKSQKAFCSHCGRLVAGSARNCPHCLQSIGSLPVYISSLMEQLEEEKRATKEVEPGRLQKTLDSLWQQIDEILVRLDLSLKELVYMGILTFFFIFLSLITHVRYEIYEEPRWVPPYRLQIWYFYYGIPLEWLGISHLRFRSFGNVFDITISWVALFVDFVVFFLSSFAIVYVSTRLYERVSGIRQPDVKSSKT
jgi:hypothetical protein